MESDLDNFQNKYQAILETLPLPWKYLQQSPRRSDSSGESEGSSDESIRFGSVEDRKDKPQGAFGGSRNGGENVPTAHVQPHPASRSRPVKAMHIVSKDVHISSRSSTPEPVATVTASTKPQDTGVAGFKAAESIRPRRWRSLSSIPPQEEFMALQQDPDNTILTDPKVASVNSSQPDPTRIAAQIRPRQSNVDLSPRLRDTVVTSSSGSYVERSHNGTKSSHDTSVRTIGDESSYTRHPSELMSGTPSAWVTPELHNMYKQRFMEPRQLITSTQYVPRHTVSPAAIYDQIQPVPASVEPLHPVVHTQYEGRISPALYRHNYPLYDQVTHVATVPVATVPIATEVLTDLTQWQQRHQEQLKRQIIETTEPVCVASAPVQSTTSKTSDSHNLDAIRQAADNIIKEKDKIIYRLKSKLYEEEQRPRGPDLTPEPELKAKNEEVVEKMENEELQKLRQLFEQREVEFAQEREKSESLQQKLDQMERYLSDLPTSEEKMKQAADMKSLKEDNARYKARLMDRDRKLTDLSRLLQSRESVIREKDSKEKEYSQKIDKLQNEIKKLQKKCAPNEGENETPTVEAMEELKRENKQRKKDMQSAKKLLDGQHRKLQQAEIKHRSELEQLKERVSQEEAAVTGLREELSSKDQHLKKLRASIKELGSQNQDLMEKNLLLQERVKALEQQSQGEVQQLQQRLMKELQVCFSDLRAMVQVCLQQADGQDPNVSLLLGVKGLESDKQPVSLEDAASLKHHLGQIRELRQQMDKLREQISTKYAENMAHNLDCIQQ